MSCPSSLFQQWQHSSSVEPDFGYFPNASKTVLIVNLSILLQPNPSLLHCLNHLKTLFIWNFFPSFTGRSCSRNEREFFPSLSSGWLSIVNPAVIFADSQYATASQKTVSNHTWNPVYFSIWYYVILLMHMFFWSIYCTILIIWVTCNMKLSSTPSSVMHLWLCSTRTSILWSRAIQVQTIIHLLHTYPSFNKWKYFNGQSTQLIAW